MQISEEMLQQQIAELDKRRQEAVINMHRYEAAIVMCRTLLSKMDEKPPDEYPVQTN